MIIRNADVKNHVLRTTQDYRVTSPFGMRTMTVNGVTTTRMHNGIDLVPRSDIIAMERGKVIRVVRTIRESDTPAIMKEPATIRHMGNLVFLQHENGMETRYTHLQFGTIPSRIVEGAIVEKGEVLGHMGTTGFSTGIHLHFEVVNHGKRVDPIPFILGQQNIIGYGTQPKVSLEGISTIKILARTLNFRRTPNGERLGTLPQGETLVLLGITDTIAGFRWARVEFDGVIGFCAIQNDWVELNINKTVEVIKEVVIPVSETIDKGTYTISVAVDPK